MHSLTAFWFNTALLFSTFNSAHSIAPRQVSYPSGAGYDVPPLPSIVSNYPLQPTVPLPPAPAGATLFAGAPAIPPLSNMEATTWPDIDVTPRTDSPEVKEWLKEIEGIDIPKLSITNGDCSDPANADSGSDKRCWWTCGGCVRPTDVATCNKKGHWGLTFDDGPSESTPKLLTYLNSVGVKATFFLVGSRVIGAPETVQYQHATGHELAVHTWSHPSLTNLTNEQIVAELGWTRKAIKDATGVTPLTMRPPRGDIDDRVRAVSMAMGLTPVLWTGSDESSFDTNDWRVPAGEITAETSISAFQKVLNSTMDSLSTGFVTLEHDLYPQTVDLAIGTTIPDGLERKLTLEPVTTCQDKPLSESYRETSKNPLASPPRAQVTTTSATAVTTVPKAPAAGTRTAPKSTGNPAVTPSPSTAGAAMLSGGVWRSFGAIAFCWSFLSLI